MTLRLPRTLLIALAAAHALAATADGQSPGSATNPPASTRPAPASAPLSADEDLWRRIRALDALPAMPAASQGAEAARAWFVQAREQRQALVSTTRAYLFLFPGGAHVDDVARLELSALLELSSLGGAPRDAVCARARELAINHPTEGVVEEAAYWEIACRQAQRSAAAIAPLPADAGAGPPPGDALLADYDRHVQRFPNGRYAPQMIEALFANAQRRGDRPRMRDLAERLAQALPEHPTAQRLLAVVKRSEAVGQPFSLRFATASGVWVDTCEFDAPIVIVVWGGFDAASLDLMADVQCYRRENPPWVAIGVCVDADAARAARLCAERGIDWPQWNDGLGWGHAFVREWGVRDVPYLFIIDRAGRLVSAGPPDSGWETWLNVVAAGD